MACLESPLISEKRREPQQRFLLMGQVAGSVSLVTFLSPQESHSPCGAKSRIKIKPCAQRNQTKKGGINPPS
jgi:hypothetical protein